MVFVSGLGINVPVNEYPRKFNYFNANILRIFLDKLK
jgi:hypothetical protein